MPATSSHNYYLIPLAVLHVGGTAQVGIFDELSLRLKWVHTAAALLAQGWYHRVSMEHHS